MNDEILDYSILNGVVSFLTTGTMFPKTLKFTMFNTKGIDIQYKKDTMFVSL